MKPRQPMADRPRRGGRGGFEPRVRIHNRERRVIDMTLKGMSQTAIAVELQISQPAVSKILQRVEERWMTECVHEIQRLRVRHTMVLRHMQKESLQAWERSKADHTRKRQRKTQRTGRDGATVAEVIVENEHGDPRYLEQARKALAEERKIWGVDAPDSVAIEMAATTPSYSDLSIEELERLWKNAGAALGLESNGLKPAPLTLPAAEVVRGGGSTTTEEERMLEMNTAAYAAVLKEREQSRQSGEKVRINSPQDDV